jgi:outer membrane lipoprotein-sorting protein
MVGGRRRTTGRAVAVGVAVAGAVGLGLLAAPPGAGAAPQLPPVAAEELVASVLAADPGPFGGTVELDSALGLPALSGVPQAADGTSTARVWSDGEGRGRVQVPTATGERTLVSDGRTFWSWNSADRSVTTAPVGELPAGGPGHPGTDPTAAAARALAALRATSEVGVDGTAQVAGRPAYELVLTPAPSERTLLREIRVAVDAQRRVPLRMTVLANGSSEPAVQLGFTELEFGAQDAALFTFTPPPGAQVEEGHRSDGPPRERAERLGDATPATVGDGWDTVLVSTAPELPRVPGRDRFGGAPDLAALGTPVSGPWGSGRLIRTAVASAIVTDDGRIAAGAVPEQVLTEALAR